MFKFFKSKNDEQIPENDVIASVTYLIKKDHNGALIDIELKDYDDESIEALSQILDILGDDRTFIDTINIIKSSFAEKDRYDLLVKIFSHVQPKLRNKLSNLNQPKLDKPCVKPSEIWNSLDHKE